MGTRLIVLRGRSTRSTRSDFTVESFSPPAVLLPLKSRANYKFSEANMVPELRLSHIISMAKEVMAQETTSMSMAFHSSLRYDPGCRITP